ncbi:hypothetical protein QOT17_017545 [Balamuthia mandrillaris]
MLQAGKRRRRRGAKNNNKSNDESLRQEQLAIARLIYGEATREETLARWRAGKSGSDGDPAAALKTLHHHKTPLKLHRREAPQSEPTHVVDFLCFLGDVTLLQEVLFSPPTNLPHPSSISEEARSTQKLVSSQLRARTLELAALGFHPEAVLSFLWRVCQQEIFGREQAATADNHPEKKDGAREVEERPCYAPQFLALRGLWSRCASNMLGLLWAAMPSSLFSSRLDPFQPFPFLRTYDTALTRSWRPSPSSLLLRSRPEGTSCTLTKEPLSLMQLCARDLVEFRMRKIAGDLGEGGEAEAAAVGKEAKQVQRHHTIQSAIEKLPLTEESIFQQVHPYHFAAVSYLYDRLRNRNTKTEKEEEVAVTRKMLDAIRIQEHLWDLAQKASLPFPPHLLCGNHILRVHRQEDGSPAPSFVFGPLTQFEKERLYFVVQRNAKEEAPRRPIDGSPSIVDRASFLRRFHAFTGGLFEDWTEEDWANVLVVGGSVVASLLPPNSFASKEALAESEASYRDADVDFFFYGLSPQRLLDKIQRVHTLVKRHLLLQHQQGNTSFSQVTAFTTPHTLTLKRSCGNGACSHSSPASWGRGRRNGRGGRGGRSGRGGGYLQACHEKKADASLARPLQLVLGLWGQPVDLLTNGDVDGCCVAFDGQDVWMSTRAFMAINHRWSLFYDRSYSIRGCPDHEKRLLKYAKRGLDVAVEPALVLENHSQNGKDDDGTVVGSEDDDSSNKEIAMVADMKEQKENLVRRIEAMNGMARHRTFKRAWRRGDLNGLSYLVLSERFPFEIKAATTYRPRDQPDDGYGGSSWGEDTAARREDRSKRGIRRVEFEEWLKDARNGALRLNSLEERYPVPQWRSTLRKI